MARLIELPVDAKGKNKILVEVSDEVPAAKAAGKTSKQNLGAKLGVGDSVVQKAGRNLEDALKDISPAIDALRNMAMAVSKPKEISLEIGLKLSAKAGVVLASADAEGSLKVTLKWVT